MKRVVCRTSVEGFHAWENAPEQFDFLKFRHHHFFNVVACFEVSHNDRDIEFIVKANEIKSYLENKYSKNGYCEFGNMSCEDIAEELISAFNGMQSCEVNEDGFGGAIIEKE